MLGSVSPVWAESSAGFALVFDGTDDLTTLLSTHITAEHWAKEGDEADRDTPAARAALAEAGQEARAKRDKLYRETVAAQSAAGIARMADLAKRRL